MTFTHGWPRGHRVALVGSGAALATTLAAAVAAWHLPPLPEPAPLGALMAPAVVPASDAHATALDGRGRDPFDRSRAEAELAESFAAAEPDVAPRTDPQAPAAPAVRLVGVVLRADGAGTAALSLVGGPTRLVRVGQRFEGWQVRAVGSGSATLSGGDSVFVLRVGGVAAGGVR